MKQFYLSMTVWSSLCLGTLFAQDSSRANLFPLHDGDYWEYDSWQSGFPDSVVFTATRRVIGDTLMPNGMTYKYIRESDFNYNNGSLFLRVDDSLNVFEFRSILDSTFEKLLFKLNAQISESWFPWYPDTGIISQVVDIYEVEAFGEKRKVMEIHEEAQIVFWDYTLIEGIGLVFWGGGEGFSWSLRGAIIDGQQYGTATSVKDREEDIPRLFQLYQNYPNPFNAETTIRYRLAKPSVIQIIVYDITGKEVAILVDKEIRFPGEYSVTWNGKNQKGGDVSSGIHFYQLRTGNFVVTKRALLIK